MILPAHIRADDPASLIANFLFAGQVSRQHEPEVAHLSSFVTQGDSVLDVGVHLGQYACHLARLVGRTGHLTCVEPIPELARYIRAATRALNLPVEVVEAAASDRDGTAPLHIPLDGGHALPPQASLHAHGATVYQTIDVRLIRLDDLDLPRPVDVIKIDVEGHELSVLRGAIGILERDRPALLVEIERRHSPHPIQDTFAFLDELGYDGAFVDDQGDIQPLARFNADLHQIPDRPDTRYVNNFFLVPRRVG